MRRSKCIHAERCGDCVHFGTPLKDSDKHNIPMYKGNKWAMCDVLNEITAEYTGPMYKECNSYKARENKQ